MGSGEWGEGFRVGQLAYSGYQSHAPSNDFFLFQKLRFGGRQSNVSMTIMASAVSGTTISMSILTTNLLRLSLPFYH